MSEMGKKLMDLLERYGDDRECTTTKEALLALKTILIEELVYHQVSGNDWADGWNDCRQAMLDKLYSLSD